MFHRIVRLLNGRFLVDSVGLGCNESFDTPFEAQALASLRRLRLGGKVVLINDGLATVW